MIWDRYREPQRTGTRAEAVPKRHDTRRQHRTDRLFDGCRFSRLSLSAAVPAHCAPQAARIPVRRLGRLFAPCRASRRRPATACTPSPSASLGDTANAGRRDAVGGELAERLGANHGSLGSFRAFDTTGQRERFVQDGGTLPSPRRDGPAGPRHGKGATIREGTMTHRARWTRPFAALFALWFAFVIGDPGLLHACPCTVDTVCATRGCVGRRRASHGARRARCGRVDDASQDASRITARTASAPASACAASRRRRAAARRRRAARAGDVSRAEPVQLVAFSLRPRRPTSDSPSRTGHRPPDLVRASRRTPPSRVHSRATPWRASPGPTGSQESSWHPVPWPRVAVRGVAFIAATLLLLGHVRAARCAGDRHHHRPRDR